MSKIGAAGTYIVGMNPARSQRVEEAVVHVGKRRRTSSAGTVRPASASRMPSSMAARVPLSSSSTTGDGFSRSNFFDFAMRLG